MFQQDKNASKTLGGFTRVETLTYELKVKDVMTRDVVFVAPGDRIAHLSALLQKHQISGAPVLSDDQLVGIVSVQDVMRALRNGDLEAQVSEYMTASAVTVGTDHLLVKALDLFSQTGVGRLPVVNQEGDLVGIITKGDVARGLLQALQSDRDEEEIRRYRASHLFEDIVSDRTSLILRYRVPLGDFA
jgi:predicted transcriptional regulator